MISKQELRFAQKVVRRGLVKGEVILDCIEIMNAGLMSKDNTLMEVLIQRGHISRKIVKEIEEENFLPLPLVGKENSIEKVGAYELLEKLGEGAMGTVYKARKIKDNCLVALKILDPELAQDPEFIRRFLQEAKNVAKLRNHENIVQAYDFGHSDGRYYFAMEFVQGCSLAEILYTKGKISEKTALSITKQVASALNHAHHFSIIHRDIKPENIMISKEGIAKLCDLGLAKDLSEGFRKSGGITLGTLYYASPEQVRGSKKVDIRSDIYSLGICLYHMLAGELPFTDNKVRRISRRPIYDEIPPLAQKAPHVSPFTLELVKKMTEKAPQARYQTPQELLEDMEKNLEPQRINTPTHPTEVTLNLEPSSHGNSTTKLILKKKKVKSKISYPWLLGLAGIVLLLIAILCLALS